MKRLKLDYNYSAEPEQFTFIRIPNMLFSDERYKKLDSDAKLLYMIWGHRPTVDA